MKKILPVFFPLILVATLGAADPARLELAHQVVKAMHADKIFDQISAQMQQSVAQMPGLSPANATPEQKAKAEKVMQQVMALSMESAKGILPKMDEIYAEVFSEAELIGLKTFYESPTGAAMMEKQPQLMQRLMPLIMTMQQDLQPKIQKVIADAQAEGSSDAAPAQK